MGVSETLYIAATDLCGVLRSRGDKDAQRRLTTFRTRVDHAYQCPNCWIKDERMSSLVAVPGTEREDRMKCHECGADFAIPLGG